MSLVDTIRGKAKKTVRRIVLPEGDEPRTAAAAKIIRDEGLAETYCQPTSLLGAGYYPVSFNDFALSVLKHLI